MGILVESAQSTRAGCVDSPTLVIIDNTAAGGLFPVFDQVFTSIWEWSKPV
ncbi:MAG: hypothetical protein K0R62_2112 [Nonomuraea muscovyensis]|jgi:hypothetical protein|nr:hypothetical protein [Nonomuraea muscovyensis]